MYSRRQFVKTTATVATASLVSGLGSHASSFTPLLLAATGATSKQTLDARALFALAVTENVTLAADGSRLELALGETVQDDGIAAGFSYKPNVETLSATVMARKQLLIDSPQATAAMLMVGPGGPGLRVSINGHQQALGVPGATGYRQWQVYPIPPEHLRQGSNDVVLSGTGELWIARSDDSPSTLPKRSARSGDGGVSWKTDSLGPEGTIAGEYYVRIFLEHYLRRGSILLPVMDAANLSAHDLGPPVTAMGPIQIAVTAQMGVTHHEVSLRVRSGTTFVPQETTWTDWTPIDRIATLSKPRGRYIQLEVTLATRDPLTSPALQSISLETSPAYANDWSKQVEIKDAHNEDIIRTSIPFRYEPFSEAALKELRTRYHLDEVVAGAATELDLLCRLVVWSSQQWNWGEWHLGESYPPWNALEILKKGADGKPVGGFCEQYDLVFLQAAESFGFVGRQISISNGALGRPDTIGHEPTEIWSNQFRKWIYLDATYAAYIVDASTEIPLSLFEVRQRQIFLMRGQASNHYRIVHLHPTVPLWRDLTQDLAFAELRLIPRSNFLQQKSPLPLNAGWERAWFWNGYYVWSDAMVPAELLHVNRVTQYNNFEWTLNQAKYKLEAGFEPGQIRVHLDTETPGFVEFIATIDGQAKQPVDAIFDWKLHPGSNTLKVWPRNSSGRDGIASWINLEMLAV
jgi:hypothetical protein